MLEAVRYLLRNLKQKREAKDELLCRLDALREIHLGRELRWLRKRCFLRNLKQTRKAEKELLWLDALRGANSERERMWERMSERMRDLLRNPKQTRKAKNELLIRLNGLLEENSEGVVNPIRGGSSDSRMLRRSIAHVACSITEPHFQLPVHLREQLKNLRELEQEQVWEVQKRELEKSGLRSQKLPPNFSLELALKLLLALKRARATLSVRNNAFLGGTDAGGASLEELAGAVFDGGGGLEDDENKKGKTVLIIMDIGYTTVLRFADRVDEAFLESSGRMKKLSARIKVGDLTLVAPEENVIWLGKTVGKCKTFDHGGGQWVMRIRGNKVFVKKKLRSRASRVKTALQTIGGVKVLGSGVTMNWQESEDVDEGVVREILNGVFGIEACRWLLHHIWRGNVKVAQYSPTRSYCPTPVSDEGYRVSAMVPFEAIKDTRFYYHRKSSAVYWHPMKGEKLRKVSVANGGSIEFTESEFEDSEFEICSIETTRSVA